MDGADLAWQALADACVEHDYLHECRALTELHWLGQIPRPRQDPAEVDKALDTLLRK